MNVKSQILSFLRNKDKEIRENKYYRNYVSQQLQRVSEIRSKSKVRVLFVLWDLSMWKTESLYRMMLSHPRFEPMLGLVVNMEDIPSAAIEKFLHLKEYITNKGYKFVELSGIIMKELKADFVFYEKPYSICINPAIWFDMQNALVCHCNYAFNSINLSWGYNMPLHRFSTFYFLENKLVEDFMKAQRVDMHKFRLTGLPFMDDLLKPKEAFKNPWTNNSKKRIIWAPHFSIPETKGALSYSCFMDVCESMLELADKYKDDVHFAIKPHPLLRSKLTDLWGKEKMEEYFEKWQNKANAQIEQGEYLGLFKYSDAMIHDCGSFTIEYLYTGNPVMYLVNGLPHIEQLNEFAQGAYKCHYMGGNYKDIEKFILDVINGVDPMKEIRHRYFGENLLPPNGKSACENIINAILGQNGYN